MRVQANDVSVQQIDRNSSSDAVAEALTPPRARKTAEAVASPFHLGGWLASDGIQPSRPPRGVLPRGSHSFLTRPAMPAVSLSKGTEAWRLKMLSRKSDDPSIWIHWKHLINSGTPIDPHQLTLERCHRYKLGMHLGGESVKVGIVGADDDPGMVGTLAMQAD